MAFGQRVAVRHQPFEIRGAAKSPQNVTTQQSLGVQYLGPVCQSFTKVPDVTLVPGDEFIGYCQSGATFNDVFLVPEE